MAETFSFILIGVIVVIIVAALCNVAGKDRT